MGYEPPTTRVTLADVPRGARVRVIQIDSPDGDRLAAVGLRNGQLLTVEQDAPFGGPRLVRLGAARLALARSITRTITVQQLAEGDR